MENYVLPLTGGIIIGLAISLMLYLNGRVTGVSGILNAAIGSTNLENLWRWSFLVGLLAGGLILRTVFSEALIPGLDRSPGVLILAGLLVGFGTVLGGGCTSGHGICGISRFSLRSILATIIFMGFGILSASLFRIYFEGAL